MTWWPCRNLVYYNFGEEKADFGVAFENGDQSLALLYPIKPRSLGTIRRFVTS